MTTDLEHDVWQQLEADFARVLGEIPMPVGPELNEQPRNSRELPISACRCVGSGNP